MCKYSYSKLSNRTQKEMLFCKRLDNNENEIDQICLWQRYCKDTGKYIERNQSKNCKYYK